MWIWAEIKFDSHNMQAETSKKETTKTLHVGNVVVRQIFQKIVYVERRTPFVLKLNSVNEFEVLPVN